MLKDQTNDHLTTNINSRPKAKVNRGIKKRISKLAQYDYQRDY